MKKEKDIIRKQQQNFEFLLNEIEKKYMINSNCLDGEQLLRLILAFMKMLPG